MEETILRVPAWTLALALAGCLPSETPIQTPSTTKDTETVDTAATDPYVTTTRPTDTDTHTPTDTGSYACGTSCYYTDTGSWPTTTTEPLGSYVRTTATSTPLVASGQTPVLSVDVPAGEWVVSGKATAVNFGAADYARCVLLADGVQLDASATLVGNQGGGPTGETGPSAATLVVQAVGVFDLDTTVELQCLHDFYGGGVYIDPDASLRLFPAPGALAASNASSVALPSYGPAEIASISAGTGQWAVLAKGTAVSFTSNDYARGTIVEDGAIVDASATLIGDGAAGATGEQGPSAATVEMLALYGGGGTVGLGFVHDAYLSGLYVDPLGSIVAVPSNGALLGTSTGATVLPTYGGSTVVSLDVPAGTWAISAKATAVDFGQADYVRCTVSHDGTALNGATTLVGDQGAGPTGELGPSAATLMVQGLVATAVDETFELFCSHDFGYSGPYLDPGAAILAIPVAGPIDAG